MKWVKKRILVVNKRKVFNLKLMPSGVHDTVFDGFEKI